MHHVQAHILETLMFRQFARFRDMRPPRVDTNLYSYHLRVLQQDGYVQKAAEGYTLTPKGLSYVDGLSSDNRHLRKQPKIVALFALQNEKGEWLMARRLIQPYIGQYMIPSGKQHYGESPEMHTQRELTELLGRVPSVRRCGFTDVRLGSGEEIITHITGHVYTGRYDGPPPAASKKFSYEFLGQNHPQMVEHTTDLIEAIESGESFFLSFQSLAA